MSKMAEHVATVAVAKMERVLAENARLAKENAKLRHRLIAMEGGLMRLSQIVMTLKEMSP